MDALLARLSSRQLTEWKAYECYAGPLDDTWRDEALAAIHEQLQMFNYLFSEAKFADRKKHKKGPIPKPEHYPRPNEMLRSRKQQRQEKAEDDGDAVDRILAQREKEEG